MKYDLIVLTEAENGGSKTISTIEIENEIGFEKRQKYLFENFNTIMNYTNVENLYKKQLTILGNAEIEIVSICYHGGGHYTAHHFLVTFVECE